MSCAGQVNWRGQWLQSLSRLTKVGFVKTAGMPFRDVKGQLLSQSSGGEELWSSKWSSNVDWLKLEFHVRGRGCILVGIDKAGCAALWKVLNLLWFYPRFNMQLTGCRRRTLHYVYWNQSQIAKFMGPTWGPPGSCRPQMGPMLAPWTLISGVSPGHRLMM